MQLAATARCRIKKLKDRAAQLRYSYRGFFESPGIRIDISADYRVLSRELIDIAAIKSVHSVDYMPDRWTMSGIAMVRSPHYEFAKAYLTEASFNFRKTEYFAKARSGHLSYPCRSEEAADLRCWTFIRLIEQIKREGCRPTVWSGIKLMRCRNGSVMVMDGKHRFAVLLALGAREVLVEWLDVYECQTSRRRFYEKRWPRRFYSQMEKWWKEMDGGPEIPKREVEGLKSQIRALKMATWADLYHAIPFPEFSDMTTQTEPVESSKRLKMIVKRTRTVAGKRVVDVGCNVGYYSIQLARRGATVYGVDGKAENVSLAGTVAALYGIRARFERVRVTEEWVDGLQSNAYDIALCFSVFQWIIDDIGMKRGLGCLRRLSEKAHAMFFDIAVNSGKACLRTTRGHELVFVEELLKTATRYEDIEYLGDVEPYGSGSRRHVFYCSS